VLDVLHTLFGEVSHSEAAVIALFFAAILMFAWAPRIGEAIGGMFDE